jgi:hypothetical protein
MNYKALVNRKFTEFQESFPEYTIAQILYSTIAMFRKGKEFKKSDFLEMTDKDVYEGMSKAYAHEKEIQSEEASEIISNN